MQQIKDIFSIANNYDLFLVDLWGVVHDGSELYSGVESALQYFKENNKQVIFISNAPRRASKVKAVLSALGVDESLYLDVVSSGEVGYQFLASGGAYWGANYYYLGPIRDADVLSGLDYKRDYDLKNANFLLNVGFGSEERNENDYLEILQQAQKLDLPMLCLNPDKEVVKITGERFACAGVIAAQYLELGGKITWFGKPYKEIYTYCLSSIDSIRKIEKSRILAIGDSLETDIAGGFNYGIDTLLIRGGILKGKSIAEINSKCAELAIQPSYLADSLVFSL